MKRIIGILTAVVTVMLLTSAVCAEEDIRVYLDGAQIISDVAPRIVGDRTLVPMRAVFEAFDMEIDWNDKSQTVTAADNSRSVTVSVGADTMTSGGRELALDVPAQIFDDRTFIPVRAVSESLGCEVKWDTRERKVIIISSPDKVVGAAVINPMRCLIDYQPIDHININGYTYIKAFDLEDYGFDIAEDGENIYITRNKTKLPLLIDKYKNGMGGRKTGECHTVRDLWRDPEYGKQLDLFEPDRSVYLDGAAIDCFNADGETYIMADALQRYGPVEWIDNGPLTNFRGLYIDSNTLLLSVAYGDLDLVNTNDLYNFTDSYSGFAKCDVFQHYGAGVGISEYKNKKRDGYGYYMSYWQEMPSHTIYEAGEYEDGVLKNGVCTRNERIDNGWYSMARYEVINFEEYRLE